MKFKIDQNLPIEAADVLTAAGHDALSVYQQSLGGAPDDCMTNNNRGPLFISL